MTTWHRYAIAALACALLATGFVAAFRAGEVAGQSSLAPIVIRASSAAAPPPTLAPAMQPAPAQGGGRRVRRERGGRSEKLKKAGDGFVNVNSASAGELERLPGVGPKMAERIIECRRQVGSFRSPEDLGAVSGLGPKKLAKMAPFLRF